MHDDSIASKFIVFKIAEYHLALPISVVLKVLNCAAAGSEFTTMGILQLGRHTIRVVDLQERLHSGNSGEKPRNSPFLVISRTPGGELCGIPVEEPPNLVELPLETIQTLPKADRYSKPALNLVSHVAVLSQEKVTTTIFLLDLQQVLNPTLPDAYPLALKSS